MLTGKKDIMQFRDLKMQYEVLRVKIDEQIKEVIGSTSFIGGEKVDELEKKLAEYVGVKHCITCANGTDALMMALMAWNIKPGDCVFVPDFTFFASAEVIAFLGATPVFVDVDESTFNIDSVRLEEAILRVINEGKLIPKAIIAVDLFGLPADYDAIRPIADKYGLKLLEDGAQGFGGAIRGKKACSFGDISTTSFFPAKPLGCYGDGGAVFTDDDEVAIYLRSIGVHGKGNGKYDNVRIGINSRLDTLQAGILIPKLEAFIQYELKQVNKVARSYSEKLQEAVIIPQFNEKYTSSWAQYSILLKDRAQRDGLQQYLKENDIPSMIYYIKPLHMQGAFKEMKCVGPFDVTEQICERILSLPMHPYLDEKEIAYIAEHVLNYVKARE